MIKARNLRPRDGLSANCREKSELCCADSEGSKIIVVYCRDCLREQARASKNIARSRGRVRFLVDAFHEGPRLPSRTEPNSAGLHQPYEPLPVRGLLSRTLLQRGDVLGNIRNFSPTER
jgi:hypothetical protein